MPKCKCAKCGYEIEVQNLRKNSDILDICQYKDRQFLIDKCGWIFFFHYMICFVCKNKPLNCVDNPE